MKFNKGDCLGPFIGAANGIVVPLERVLIALALVFVVGSALFPPRSAETAIASNGTVDASSGFRSGAVYPTTEMRSLPSGLRSYGSWLGSDASVGITRSPWYPGRADVAIYVCGYPSGPGLSLVIETQNAGSAARIALKPDNPGERWQRVHVHLGASKRFRIVAEDRSASSQGWLGFSDPVSDDSGAASTAIALLRLSGTCVLVLVLLFSPGLLLARRYEWFRDLSLLYVPGVLSLLAAGVLLWAIPADGVRRDVLTAGATVYLLCLLYATRRRPLFAHINATARNVFIIAVAVFCLAVGRSMYSLGPTGELYEGTISRTYEPGDRSDSRIGYHIVQLVLNHASPYHPPGSSLFSPWTFSDRGPIAGLAGTPIVALSGAGALLRPPDDAVALFDWQGFEAYRIAMFGFASLVLLALYGAVQRAAGTRTAAFAIAIAAVAPFTVHETLFTWPKLLAAALVCTTASLAMMRKPFLAGFALGFGYLIHPSVLFAGLSLFGAYFVLRRSPNDVMKSVVASAAGIALWLIFWRIINGAHYSQAGFAQYILRTGDDPRSVAGWIHSRADSLANTLIPLWLTFIDSSNRQVNRLGGESSFFVHIQFTYWSTLPFAVGLFYLPAFTRRLFTSVRAAPVLFCAVIAGPFLIFAVYWGMTITGMMREGLQWWFFALIGFVAIYDPQLSQAGAFARDRPWFLLRILEVWLVTVGLTALDRGAILGHDAAATDSIALVVILCASLLLLRSVYAIVEPFIGDVTVPPSASSAHRPIVPAQ